MPEFNWRERRNQLNTQQELENKSAFSTAKIENRLACVGGRGVGRLLQKEVDNTLIRVYV